VDGNNNNVKVYNNDGSDTLLDIDQDNDTIVLGSSGGMSEILFAVILF
jgi:hypothetical protein